MAAKKKSFEESLARLGEVVRTLERGDAPLADSLKLCDEGAALITACTEELDEAESLTPEKLPFAEAVAMVQDGRIKDGKTVAAILKIDALRRRKAAEQ